MTHVYARGECVGCWEDFRKGKSNQRPNQICPVCGRHKNNNKCNCSDENRGEIMNMSLKARAIQWIDYETILKQVNGDCNALAEAVEECVEHVPEKLRQHTVMVEQFQEDMKKNTRSR